MQEGDDDLELSLGLSLCSSVLRCTSRLNLMLTASPPPTPTGDRQSHSERRSKSALDSPLPRGLIDVNWSPAEEIDDEFARASSPNRSSTVSSNSGAGGKRSYREHSNYHGASDEEDGEAPRKKLRLSRDQSAILEDLFAEHKTLNTKQKLALAKELNLRPRQVEVWFQNRRARTKLKKTESDCEHWKLCCENLTEEIRRLQKENQELRALTLSPPFYTRLTPPAALTTCPTYAHFAAANPAAAPRLSTAAPPPAASSALVANPWALATVGPML